MTWQSELLHLHNARRRRQLTLESRLSTEAQRHANWMSNNNRLSHEEGRVSFSQRVTRSGYRYSRIGENVGLGYTAVIVFGTWMVSPGHRSNILDERYSHIGIGRAESINRTVYWCVVFGAPANWIRSMVWSMFPTPVESVANLPGEPEPE